MAFKMKGFTPFTKKGPKKSRLKKIWEGLQEVGESIKSSLDPSLGGTGLSPDQQTAKMWREIDKQDPRRKLIEGRKKKENKSFTKVKGNKGMTKVKGNKGMTKVVKNKIGNKKKS